MFFLVGCRNYVYNISLSSLDQKWVSSYVTKPWLRHTTLASTNHYSIAPLGLFFHPMNVTINCSPGITAHSDTIANTPNMPPVYMHTFSCAL